MEPKRLTLALILCTVFVLGYSLLVQRTRPMPEPSDPPADSGEREPGRGAESRGDAGDGSASPTDGDETSGPGGESDPGEGSPEAAANPVEVGEERERFLVETDRLIVDFDSLGAVPVRVRLRGLTKDAGLDPTDNENLVAVVDTFEEGRSPLALRFPDESFDLASMNWRYEGETRDGDRRVFTFAIAPGNGLRIEKRFGLADGEDHISLDVRFTTLASERVGQRTAWTLAGPAGIVFEGSPIRKQDVTFAAASLPDGRMRTVSIKDVVKVGRVAVAVDVGWVGVVSKYFAAVLEPVDPADGGGPRVEQALFDGVVSPDLVEYYTTEKQLSLEAARQKSESKLGARLEFFDALPAEGASLESSFRFFVGLKDADHLSSGPYAAYAPLLELNGMTTCGMGWIVKPIASLLLIFLNGIYAVIGNYGIAIIALTILVKLAIFPVTRHQQVTMASYQAKMQKYKPELDRLREKYKNNRQRLNQETLKFFKEKGINPFPLGGCLPMFATLPIFFGLFYLLRTAPELRQAPFAFWIQDLSRPDQLSASWPHLDLMCLSIHGLNLLPILMTVAWFLQQRMMPKPQDPQQAQTQQMMMFMPIVFGFMLYDFASGLSLYWLTNSCVGIVEQKFIRRRIAANTGKG